MAIRRRCHCISRISQEGIGRSTGSSVLKMTLWPVTTFSVRLFHSSIQHPGESMAVAKVGTTVSVTLSPPVRCFSQWNAGVSDFPSSDCSRGFKANSAFPQYYVCGERGRAYFWGVPCPLPPEWSSPTLLSWPLARSVPKRSKTSPVSLCGLARLNKTGRCGRSQGAPPPRWRCTASNNISYYKS